MRYRVVYVEDADLPASQDWAIVRTPSETFLFVREAAISEALLSRIWRCWQGLDGGGVVRQSFTPAGVVR